MNMRRKYAIQALGYSAMNVLLNPYPNLSSYEVWFPTLIRSAVMDLIASGLEIVKQLCSKVWQRAWDPDFSSKPLVPVGIFNCHTENANAMAMVLQDLSTVSFNRSYTPPANDDQQEKQQKRWKESWWIMKKMEVQSVKNWENVWDFAWGSEKND